MGIAYVPDAQEQVYFPDHGIYRITRHAQSMMERLKVSNDDLLLILDHGVRSENDGKTRLSIPDAPLIGKKHPDLPALAGYFADINESQKIVIHIGLDSGPLVITADVDDSIIASPSADDHSQSGYDQSEVDPETERQQRIARRTAGGRVDIGDRFKFPVADGGYLDAEVSGEMDAHGNIPVYVSGTIQVKSSTMYEYATSPGYRKTDGRGHHHRTNSAGEHDPSLDMDLPAGLSSTASIKALRKSAKVSQKDAAQLLGVSTPTYTAREKGERPFTVRELITLADSLGAIEENLLDSKHEEYQRYAQLFSIRRGEALPSTSDDPVDGTKEKTLAFSPAASEVESARASVPGTDVSSPDLPDYLSLDEQVVEDISRIAKAERRTVEAQFLSLVDLGLFYYQKELRRREESE
jgi:transcriptional regulator with XRE-family HTH domain